MIRSHCIAFLTLSITVGVLASGASAAIVTVDDFRSTTLATEIKRTTVGATTYNDTPLGDVLGGTRQITLGLTSTAGPQNDTAMVYPADGDSAFEYTSSTLANGWVQFAYGTGTPLNIDLSGAPTLYIRFLDFDFANGQDLDLSVELFDGVTTNTFVTTVTSVPQIKAVDLSSFTGDLAAITRLKVLFDPPKAGDFLVSEIYFDFPNNEHTIPEPASLGLLALAGAALIRRGAR